jgi:transmembrane sensor
MCQARSERRHTPVPDVPANIIDQAIAWAVKLHSGTAGPEDIEACEAWRDEAPVHEQAWQRIQTVDQQLQAVPERAAPLACLTLENTLRNRSASRRRVLKFAALAAVFLGTGMLIDWRPWGRREMHATGIGIRRPIDLDDGSHLMLNSETRIEVDYSLRHRTIRVTRGEVYIETGSDNDSMAGHRRFWVETAHARLEALGTRFNVCVEPGRTRLHVAEGAVAVELATGRVIFHPGDTVLADTARNRLERVAHPDHDPTAWIHGALVAKRMRLSDFAARLNRHHATKVHVAGDVADLRVSGVFQLDGPDALTRTLNAIASSMPVTVNREGRGFVMY